MHDQQRVCEVVSKKTFGLRDSLSLGYCPKNFFGNGRERIVIAFNNDTMLGKVLE